MLLVAAVTASVGAEASPEISRWRRTAASSETRGARKIAPFVYTGVGIIKPALFETEKRAIFPLAPYFFEAAKKGRLFGQRLDGLWLHVGTPQAIEEAERKIAHGLV